VVVLIVLGILSVLIGPVLTLATGTRRRTDEERIRFLLAGRMHRLVIDVMGRPYDDLAPWAGDLPGWLEEDPPLGLRVGPGLLEIEAVLEWTSRDGSPRYTVVRRLRSRPVLTLEHRRKDAS
jgi:hypothetical protein